MTEELYNPTELEEKVSREADTTELSDIVNPDIFAGAETDLSENSQALYKSWWKSTEWSQNPETLAIFSLFWYSSSAFWFAYSLRGEKLAFVAGAIHLFVGTLYGLLSIKHYRRLRS